MTARQIIDMGEARSHFASALELTLAHDMLTEERLNQLYETILPWRNGTVLLLINYTMADAKGRLRLADDWRVNPSDELMLALETLFGTDKVRILF
jgi:DNA polymerase-3 subunit alpha